MNQIDCVVISGAGQGIGKAAAIDMGRGGCEILCISRTANCQVTAAEIVQAGGRAAGMVLDITDTKKTRAALSAWLDKTGHRKIGLVLAASILGPQTYDQPDGWEECYRVNVVGNLAIYSALLPTLLKNKFGRIVGFGGGGAAYAYPLFPAYAASKAAMVRTIENLQASLDGRGDFATVCMAPGANETNMLRQIRAAGAEVKTTVNIAEPVNFIRKFLLCRDCGFKGSFVHVRDNWPDYLDTGRNQDGKLWKLRRTEP